MTYRLLGTHEWNLLAPLFAEQNKPLPPDGIAAIAENDGEIRACLILQSALHLEPLIVKDSSVRFTRLQKLIDSLLPIKTTYYCHTNGDKMGRMAEIGGFTRTGDFWTKELR